MKEVYFKQIMIADLQNKTARVQPFEKGLNVVTSIDNHVGKSSLLKSYITPWVPKLTSILFGIDSPNCM